MIVIPRDYDISSVDFSPLHRSLRSGYRRALAEIAEWDFTTLSDDALAAHVSELSSWMREDPSHPMQARGEVLAVVGEMAARVLGQRPYLVQFLGALVVSDAQLAEMATGEGKTLASALVVGWAALAGNQVHVMTANDYLATRDAAWMGRLYRALGLTVGVTEEVALIKDRQQAYACDIVYGTATQFGFDHLADHLVVAPSYQVQRGHAWAIVDEADALLLDEARTPLIVSGAGDGAGVDRVHWAAWAAKLREHHYEVDYATKQAWLTESGMASAEKHAGVTSLYRNPQMAEQAQTALHAQVLILKDRDYLVVGEEGEQTVAIVDEGTGRILADRRWEHGIHEALEAKEGVAVRTENVVTATITIPGYLALYEHIGGMTGTAKSAEEEIAHLYDLAVVQIPTHRPRQRIDHGDVLYRTLDEKMGAMLVDITARHDAGQPVLIGAPTVEDSQMISEQLSAAGLNHTVLNARHHREEAAVIAQAGRLGAITVATNMAGRGVDILLGGDPEMLAGDLNHEGAAGAETLAAIRDQCAAERVQVLAAGGLAVLATARHSSKRIDDQLRGRAGRQGEPGSTQCYLSSEDELLVHLTGGRMGNAIDRVATLRGDAVTNRMINSMVDDAQARVERDHQDARRRMHDLDQVYAAQRTEIYRFRDAVLGRGWEENLRSWWETADELGVLADTEWPFLGDADAEGEGDGGIDSGPSVLESPRSRRDDVVMADDWDTFDVETDDLPEWARAHQSGEVSTEDDEDEYRGPLAVEDLDATIAADIAAFIERSPDCTDEMRDLGTWMVLTTIIDNSWRRLLGNLDALRDGIYLRQTAGNVQSAFGRESHALFTTMVTRMSAIGVANLRLTSLSAPEEPTASDEDASMPPEDYESGQVIE